MKRKPTLLLVVAMLLSVTVLSLLAGCATTTTTTATTTVTATTTAVTTVTVTATPTTTATTTPSGPPAIRHPIAGITDCLACHRTGGGAAPPVPASHAGRTNDTCLACHQPKI